MKWSKLKQRIEANFADAIQGHVEIWATRYRESHDAAGEGWITVEKERVFSAGTLTYLGERYEMHSRITEERDCAGDIGVNKTDAYLNVWDEANARLKNDGILDQWDFNGALFKYLNMSMEEILTSDQTFTRALGMLDRRLGKRRLRTMDVEREEPLVRYFYDLRLRFEGLQDSIE